jgi:hypothetical protein
MRAKLLLLSGLCIAYASVSGSGLRNSDINRGTISTGVKVEKFKSQGDDLALTKEHTIKNVSVLAA